jgi:PAS domain S-box-containing protein/putative nucleotidyltransferase with HDIG domain
MSDVVRGDIDHWRRALADSAQLAFVMSIGGELVAVSRGMREVIGGDAGVLEGHQCHHIMHGNGSRPDACPLHEMLLDGAQQSADVHSEVLDRDLFVTVTPIPDDTGEISLVLHVATDLTERKQMEAALRESESLLREAQRVARLGHYVYDIPAGTWTSSPALDDVFGIDETYERTVPGWLQIVHEDDRAAVGTYLREHVVRDRLPFDLEYRIRKVSDGEVRWVHGRGVLVETSPGELSRMFGVIQDVTEAHESRDALERTAGLLEEAERLAHLGSWEWDMQADVTRYSKEWQRIYGVDRDEVAITESRTFIHPADVWVVDEAVRRAKDERLPYRGRYRIIRQNDGEVRHVEVFGRPVAGPGGEVVRMYGASLDVTELTRTEEALREREARLQRMLAGTVSALVATVEMRDPYTAGHQQRVAELAAQIAQALDWDEPRVDQMHLAGLLHDIGKVIVPSEILTKPARLSEAEFQLIRTHAAAAGEILSSVEFDGPVNLAIMQHHERLDGSGYPSGLRGDDVIAEARVLAVADVFEAMVSHRPYRPALPRTRATEELQAGAGTRYDASAVAACLQLVDGGFEFSSTQN